MNAPLTPQSPTIVDAVDYVWLRGHCARLIHDEDRGADLAQETLLEAWRHRHKLVDSHGRRAWLAQIASHVAHRWLRSVYYEAEHWAPLEDTSAVSDPSFSEYDFEQNPLRDELATLLDHALALLPEDLRQALIAHYVEEMPQGEIAARLGISQGTLAVRLHRGRLRLQHLFASELRDEVADFALDAAFPPT